MFIAIIRDGRSDFRHAEEVSEEHPALDGSRVDALVTQFSEEAAVAIVDVVGDTSEIADIVIGGTAVDMVYGHTGRDRFTSPGDIDGMRY